MAPSVRGHLTIFGVFLVITTTWGNAVGIELVEISSAAKYLRMSRTALTTKNYLAQNVSGDEVEKPWAG